MYQRVYLEISKFCNLSCQFCPQSTVDPQFIALEKFAQILPQVAPITKELCLHLLGEPLAHPQLAQIFALCAEHTTAVNLTTNGTLVAQHQEILISATSLRQINFSLQSYLANFPEGRIENYLGKIGQFILMAQQHKPQMYINLRLWNHRHLQKTNPDNERIITFFENLFNLKISRGLDLGNIKSKKILPGVYFHFDSLFDWPHFSNPYQGVRGKCHALRSHLGILSDGTVVPCCLDAQGIMNLGNCLKQELATILNSPRAIKIKNGFANGRREEKLCQHCSYVNRFQKKGDGSQ